MQNFSRIQGYKEYGDSDLGYPGDLSYGEMVRLNTCLDGDSDTAPKIFDDLSERIFTDPLFLKIHWEWRTKPSTLYNECHRLGVDRVRAAIKEVMPKKGIRNKGAYLLTCLRNLKATTPCISTGG